MTSRVHCTDLARARELLADLRTRGYRRHDEMLADADASAEHCPLRVAH